VNKTALIQTIAARLRALLSAGTDSARATTAAATDPDSKAENKYDTRNLEASYLARGQAFRVAEAQAALAEFETLTAKTFRPEQAIAEGALVAVQSGGETLHYFIGPAAGGTEVTVDGVEVMVITRQAPLGAALMGRRAGESVALQPGRPAGMKITSVS
jgi:transcription elongation GreA/GreB family factor